MKTLQIFSILISNSGGAKEIAKLALKKNAPKSEKKPTNLSGIAIKAMRHPIPESIRIKAIIFRGASGFFFFDVFISNLNQILINYITIYIYMKGFFPTIIILIL